MAVCLFYLPKCRNYFVLANQELLNFWCIQLNTGEIICNTEEEKLKNYVKKSDICLVTANIDYFCLLTYISYVKVKLHIVLLYSCASKMTALQDLLLNKNKNEEKMDEKYKQ